MFKQLLRNIALFGVIFCTPYIFSMNDNAKTFEDLYKEYLERETENDHISFEKFKKQCSKLIKKTQPDWTQPGWINDYKDCSIKIYGLNTINNTTENIIERLNALRSCYDCVGALVNNATTPEQENILLKTYSVFLTKNFTKHGPVTVNDKNLIYLKSALIGDEINKTEVQALSALNHKGELLCHKSIENIFKEQNSDGYLNVELLNAYLGKKSKLEGKLSKLSILCLNKVEDKKDKKE